MQNNNKREGDHVGKNNPLKRKEAIRDRNVQKIGIYKQNSKSSNSQNILLFSKQRCGVRINSLRVFLRAEAISLTSRKQHASNGEGRVELKKESLNMKMLTPWRD